MSREFDIIVFGATGYTGQLVAEYLAQAAGDARWAIAGRSLEKLQAVKTELSLSDSVGVICADAADRSALDSLAARTKVVLTTAGPYQLYGNDLVAACAAAGTDYVDLTGESNWIADMMAAHQETAAKTGARLVFSCGFDSIPFDLGVWFTQEAALQSKGSCAPRVRARIRAMKGGLSGGTMASGTVTAAEIRKNPMILQVLANPFALTPGFNGPAQPDQMTPHQDETCDSWVIGFMMSAINSKAVHRTNQLLGHRWGADFQYDEMLMSDGPDAPPPGFESPTPLQPGEGPTREERDSGHYDILFIASWPDGSVLKASVKGDRDPGYGSTSKMIAESALCLAFDQSREETPGGCYSTGGAMAAKLCKRLSEHAGLTFAVEA